MGQCGSYQYARLKQSGVAGEFGWAQVAIQPSLSLRQSGQLTIYACAKLLIKGDLIYDAGSIIYAVFVRYITRISSDITDEHAYNSAAAQCILTHACA